MKKFVFILALVVPPLAAIAQQKPADIYEKVARAWVSTERCSNLGMISAAQGGYGLSVLAEFIKQNLNETTSHNKIGDMRVAMPLPTQVECDSVAFGVERVRNDRNQAMAASEPPPRPAETYVPQRAPQFTTCNRAFGQLSCVTY